MLRTALALVLLTACSSGGGGKRVEPVLVPSVTSKPDTGCDKVLAERTDYRVCTIDDRVVELEKLTDGSWSRGPSVPARAVRDQVEALVLLGGDCETVDESAAPGRVCLFGRWDSDRSTKKTYDFPPALASRPDSPRSVAIAKYGRLIATNGVQIGVVGLHAAAWRTVPLDVSFASGCSAPILVAPLARTDVLRFTFSVGATCGDKKLVAEATVSLMEDSNQVTVTWQPPRPR